MQRIKHLKNDYVQLDNLIYKPYTVCDLPPSFGVYEEDEQGNKITDVKGIRAACKVMKTRYTKPFEGVQVKIPYESGMNPYSGLVDMAEKAELLTREGNSLVFTTSDGETIKKFRKKWEANEDGCLDKLMIDFNKTDNVISEAESISTLETKTQEESIGD